MQSEAQQSHGLVPQSFPTEIQLSLNDRHDQGRCNGGHSVRSLDLTCQNQGVSLRNLENIFELVETYRWFGLTLFTVVDEPTDLFFFVHPRRHQTR